jgi:hypothetical protein
MRAHRLWYLVSILSVANVACSSGSSGVGNDAGLAGTTPPPPMSDHPACVISADCPAGQHCDLGECTQDCNSEQACAAGSVCSQRANCVPPSTPPQQADSDPAPSATYSGTVAATSSDTALTDQDSTFKITLKSSSSSSVRYRVEISAPHLSISQTRGEFMGEKTLTFNVSTATLKGRDVPGMVKIYTSLGDVAVNAPIHVGLTGAYRGQLRYDGGLVSLGSTKLALQLIEKNGDVSMLIDSKASLLFPASSGGEATGSGSFTLSDGIDVTVAQLIPKTVGAERNNFRRDIGRKIRFKLKPASRGSLAGTFEETIVGLFAQPITMTGTVTLDYQPRGEDPSFVLGATPTMPAVPDKNAFLDPASVFKWTDGTCETTVCAGACADPTTIKSKLTAVEAGYGQILARSMDLKTKNLTNPFVVLPDACKAAAAKTTKSLWAADSSASACNLAPPVACGLAIGARLPTSDTAGGKLFGKLSAELLAPTLLVAKNEVVTALRDSFVGGVAKEKAHYDDAMAFVAPTATWMVQPGVLEYLRSLSPDAAKGDLPTTGDVSTINDTYPAGRALADLFYTMGVIEGERARIGAASSSASQPALIQSAQERAVVTYLEAAALAEILRSWGSAPPSVAVRLTGVLNPLEDGFSALTLGANAFGVPSGFVPFVYRPEDAGKAPTNFEQMLSIADTSVQSEASIESNFLTNFHTYESNAQSVRTQINNVSIQFDQRLKEMCGATFDPSAIAKPSDWSTCGVHDAGEVGGLLLDIQQAKARLSSAQNRITAMKQKIAISRQTLANTQKVHSDTLNFVSETGDKLELITFTTGSIDVAMRAIETASNANLWNLGAPVAEAAAEAIIGELKVGLEVQKQALETAEKMRFEEAGAEIELINGMADIQKQTIDLTQLGVDIQQDVIGVVQSETRARTVVQNAQTLLAERARSASLVSMDPANDPSYRLMRDAQSLQVIKARADAQKGLYLSASALQYELNMSIPAIDGAVLNANNGSNLLQLERCLSTIYGNSRVAYGSPQDYVATVSVRKMLGITGPRTDLVTGATLSEGEQFRQLLLRNSNLDGQGGVGIVFSTDLQPGNGLWSTDVCNDRISSVQAQLVGDFLGDNQAQVNLSMLGSAFMRRCDSDAIQSWSFGAQSSSSPARIAVIQAGVNTFGDASANTSLFGQSVARTSWQLLIPGPSAAPSNADVDVTKVEDIVLKFGHKAAPRQSTPISIDLSCLASIGS